MSNPFCTSKISYSSNLEATIVKEKNREKKTIQYLTIWRHCDHMATGKVDLSIFLKHVYKDALELIWSEIA